MKALTLTQPWAALVAIGAKRIETRGWATPHRGRVAIHAAKRWTVDDRLVVADPTFLDALAVWWGPDLTHCLDRLDQQRGHVIAVTSILDCVPVEDHRVMVRLDSRPGGDTEEAFGNYAPGRWAWLLGGVEILRHPTPARGMLGLWEWDAPPGLAA